MGRPKPLSGGLTIKPGCQSVSIDISDNFGNGETIILVNETESGISITFASEEKKDANEKDAK
jgi:hypothetical protein